MFLWAEQRISGDRDIVWKTKKWGKIWEKCKTFASDSATIEGQRALASQCGVACLIHIRIVSDALAQRKVFLPFF